MLRYTRMFGNRAGPIVIQPGTAHSPPLGTLLPDLARLRQELSEHGALLLRGFQVPRTKDFDDFVANLTSRHLRYMNRSTPRETVTERVLTATSYPRQLAIPLHSESSYQRQWPRTVAFCCTQPASRGGETPIAPLRAVTADIGPELLAKFASLGVEYVRHYHKGMDLPWQEVFQTHSREALEQYCEEQQIRCSWPEQDLLRTSQVAQGVAHHPMTGATVFFNQAHLFHASSLGAGQMEALTTIFGPDRLPRHARFGDGSEITAAELERIRQAFARNEIVFGWCPSDVLLLDNMQYAHGRRPFQGRRSVFAALMDPYP